MRSLRRLFFTVFIVATLLPPSFAAHVNHDFDRVILDDNIDQAYGIEILDFDSDGDQDI